MQLMHGFKSAGPKPERPAQAGREQGCAPALASVPGSGGALVSGAWADIGTSEHGQRATLISENDWIFKSSTGDTLVSVFHYDSELTILSQIIISK